MSRLYIVLLLPIFVVAAVAADTGAGKAIYDRSCKTCHGADGVANPEIAKMMKVEIKDLKSTDVQSLSDAGLKKVVTDGKGKMRPVSSLSAKEVDEVVAYVRSLKK